MVANCLEYKCTTFPQTSSTRESLFVLTTPDLPVVVVVVLLW